MAFGHFAIPRLFYRGWKSAKFGVNFCGGPLATGLLAGPFLHIW